MSKYLKTFYLTGIITLYFLLPFKVFAERTLPNPVQSALASGSSTDKTANDKTLTEEIKITPTPELPKKGYPVVFNNETLFWIYTGTETLTAKDRAKIVTSRLREIGENPNAQINNIRLTNEKNNISIYEDKTLIMTITEDDAIEANQTRQELGQSYAEKVEYSLNKIRNNYNYQSLLLGFLFSVALTILLVILWRLTKFIFPKIYNWLDQLEENKKIPSLKIQNFELISSHNIVIISKKVIGFIRFLIIVLLLYIYFPLVLGFFPWTKGLAGKLFGYITKPIISSLKSIVEYIPNIFNIVVIIFVTYYLIKLVKIVFVAIENKTLVIPGFDESWAETTYKITSFLIIAFAAIMIFPYLPGSSSPAFQGVSVFIGLLISFGSGSAISNGVAGIVLTYTNAFKIGDRVQVGETTGDVIQKNLLVTRIRTIKNVDITIPNSIVLGGHITNYTSSSNEKGLILNTTVTIGYDIPWRKVHEALITSATKIDDILKQPKPFVLQTSLDDFYVSYQLNAYTNNSHAMARIYSELHQNIQDTFFEQGIEILSPHYRALRDGNMTTIPENYLPNNYISPSFRIMNIDDKET